MELYKYYYWLILIAITLSKPISDYFWLEKLKNEGMLISFKNLFKVLIGKEYIIMVLTGLLSWLLTIIYIFFSNIYFSNLLEVFIFILTVCFMAVTILCIKSILVSGLIIITFVNFLLIYYFQPLTMVNDLSTLNNLLSNLITSFNYLALAMAAAGLVWQFGRYQKEDTYGTISTMFYAIGYILLNMFISFIFLFLPTIDKITKLA